MRITRPTIARRRAAIQRELHRSGARPSGLPPGFGPACRDNTKNAGSKAGGGPEGPVPHERPFSRSYARGFKAFCQMADVVKLREMRAKGITVPAIAASAGVSVATVKRRLSGTAYEAPSTQNHAAQSR